MLPRIPYMMQKNQSAAVPIGTFNLSCRFNPGDVADSRGVSARKHPYLTTKKGDAQCFGDGNILSMTVFNNKLVTVVDDGGAAKLIIDGVEYPLEEVGKKSFATVNTKLVIFPDKLYYDEQDKKIHQLDTSFAAPHGDVRFEADHVKLSSATSDANGYGGRFLRDRKSFSVSVNLRKRIRDAGWYFVSGDGRVSRTIQQFNIDNVELSDFGNVHATVKIKREYYFAFKEAFQSSVQMFRPKLAAFDENNTFLGFFTEYTLDFPELGYEDFDGLTGMGSVPMRDALFENDKVANITHVHWIDVPYTSIPEEATSYVDLLGEKYENRYVSLIDEEDNNIIKGNVTEINSDAITFDLPYVTSPNTIYIGGITARAYGWGSFALVENIKPGDEIFFPESNLNTGHYTVKSVASDEIIFEDDELIENEAISESLLFTIGRWRSVIDDISNLKPGDAVTVSGSSIPENNITFVIDKIRGDVLFAQSKIFTEGVSTTDITIERKIPYLDFICEKDNRLYGVNNAEKTIYVSALGDPTKMYAYEGVSTDSYAVAVGGEGDFTACCKYGESVLFFKEDKLYKLTGSYPAEFALYSYDVPGVARGSEKSGAVINEVLYYHGGDGIYAYTGGVPTLISETFGERLFTDAVGGSDGVSYYVSMREGEKHYLLAYNTRLGLWVLEDNIGCVDLVRRANKLYYLDENGDVYAMNQDADVSGLEWFVQFVPFYETIEGKKIYSRLVFRLELPRGSYMKIEARVDGGVWQEAGKMIGRGTGIIPIRLPITRCDKFEIRLSGKGECTILDIMREYHVGSEA